MPDESWEAVVSCACDAICYNLQGLEEHAQLLAAPPAVHTAAIASSQGVCLNRRACRQDNLILYLLPSNPGAVLGDECHAVAKPELTSCWQIQSYTTSLTQPFQS